MIREIRAFLKLLSITIASLGVFGPIIYMYNPYFYYSYYLIIFKLFLPVFLFLLTCSYLSKYSGMYSLWDLLLSKLMIRTYIVVSMYFVLLKYNVFSATLFFSISSYIIFFPMKELYKDKLLLLSVISSVDPILMIFPILLITILRYREMGRVYWIYFWAIFLLYTQYFSSSLLTYHKSLHVVNSYVLLIYSITHVALKESWRVDKRKLYKGVIFLTALFLIEFIVAIPALRIKIFDEIYNRFMLFVILGFLYVSFVM